MAFAGGWHGLPSPFCSSPIFFFLFFFCQTQSHSEHGRAHAGCPPPSLIVGISFSERSVYDCSKALRTGTVPPQSRIRGTAAPGRGGGISAAVLSRSAPFVSSPFHPSILPSIHPFLRPSVHLSVHPSARTRAASHRASRTEPSPYGRDHSGSRSAVVPPGAPSGPGPSRPLPARGHDSSSTKSADRWTLRGPARGEGPRGCARPWRALTSHSSYLMLSVSFQSIFMGRRERVRSPRRGAAERGGAVQSRCALSARRSPSNGRNFSLLQRFTRSRSASLA